MKPGWLSARRFATCSCLLSVLIFASAIGVPLPVRAESRHRVCGTGPDLELVSAAFEQMQQSIDPCGDSGEIRSLLAAFQRCAKSTYRICTDPTASRNYFDRPSGPRDTAITRAITWNPALRTDLEAQCDDDPSLPVRRDPIASLLHELVHAVQDCDGLNPGEHELEAVRIENIYRRSTGLCQRGGYGEARLPPEAVKTCGAHSCPCSVPSESVEVATHEQLARSAPTSHTTSASGDAELQSEDGGD